MKKDYKFLVILLLLPLVLLTACGKNDRPSLEDRIGEAGTTTQEYSGSYEGTVQRLESLNVYRQGTHQLITEDYGTIIIQSPTIDLNRYLDELVLVKGTLQKGVGDAEDVLTVSEISYVDESKSTKLSDYENKLFGFSFSYPSNWLISEEQGSLSLRFEEKEVVSVAIYSDKTNLDSFATGREDGESTEVTIGAQRALRYVNGSQMSFYVPNPPKKKIYLITFNPSINAVDDQKGAENQQELFYDLLDSFELIYLNQVQGEKCGGLQQIECAEGYICQLESDEQYAEGTCGSIGAEAALTSCPFIAPPTTCKQYRISEYSQKGCPSRYECVGSGTASESASFRDLNVVDAGQVPEDYEGSTNDEEIVDEEAVKDEITKDDTSGDQEELVETTYEVPEVSDVTVLYANERKGFSLLMPKRWYFASFGPIDGTSWKVGFADFGLENPEESIITLSLTKEAGGSASKKVGDLYYVFDGPADLKEVMQKMADSVEVTEES